MKSLKYKLINFKKVVLPDTLVLMEIVMMLSLDSFSYFFLVLQVQDFVK